MERQNTMKIVALLTGRGNSSLKNKNVLSVCGKPLLYYPAIAAKKSKYITEFYVSSDDVLILKAANSLGYRKIVRSPELAKPDSQHISAILHALDFMKKDNINPEVLVVLLANSATIKTEWIDCCIDAVLKDKNTSAAVPVNLNLDYHPFRAKKINKEGFLSAFFDFKNKEISTNRQDLEESYFLCHNFWVLNVKESVYSKTGQPPWKFMGNKIKPYIVERCFDVHSMRDMKMTEEWIKENLSYE